jgi:hypothetical protein
LSSLATETIAIRGVLLTLLGIVMLAAISGYTARPSRSGPVSGWAVLAILAGRLCLLLGPAGMALIAGRASRNLGEAAALALAAATVLGSYMLSLIAVQIAQNVAYRLVGAPTQPIRWRVWTRTGLKRPQRRRPRHD